MTYNLRKALLTSLFLVIFSSALMAQTPNFDELKEKFQSGLIFKADFNHQLTDSYTGEQTSSSGQIWIGSNSYRLESEDQILVVDGETSKVYDSTRNRVIISEYYPEEDDFAPSKMLQGVDSTYTISEQNIDEGTLIILESTDDFAIFTIVEILIDDQQNPLEIVAFDISENESITTFSSGTFINPITNLFELNYPTDAEIVDMRE